MYVVCLATDYDGTVAHDGVVDEQTISALERWRASGRRLVLVTGREMPDLERTLPQLDLFDRVVAENGALLYAPAARKETPIAPAPPPDFVERLRAEGVAPLSVGRSIVATWEPNEKIVLEAIRDLGLDLQIVFNKGAVMVLPAGVNKASGLAAALHDLGLSAHNVVSVGDAENDHAFLQASGFAVAVANALPAVKAGADLVTKNARGAGVVELIDAVLAHDVGAFPGFSERQQIEVGVDHEERKALLSPAGGVTLIAGPSGSGKSTVSTALMERFVAQDFQVCAFDPEGDYSNFRDAVALGDAKAPPQIEEARKLLDRPDDNVVFNLLAIDIVERPVVFSQILSELIELRVRKGRPHWIMVDEAHHMLPVERHANALSLPKKLSATVLVTVDPATISPHALERVEDLFAVGAEAAETIRSFCRALSIAAPAMPAQPPEKGQALHWRPGAGAAVRLINLSTPARKAERHTRKYAQGELGPDKSFFFRGPAGALNLRAQNLTMFLQLADGVDEETWLHHLRARDYSRWARETIKDDALADEIAVAETESTLDARASRKQVREAIERRYTAPANATSD